MADYKIHFSQAEHNEKLARKLANRAPYHDWSITATFYAAIHYIECWVYNRAEKHSETSIPTYQTGEFKGRFMCSPHAWREKLVEQNSTKKAFKSLRKLRQASETARYLSLSKLESRKLRRRWLSSPASDYFSKLDAVNFIKKELTYLKIELMI